MAQWFWKIADWFVRAETLLGIVASIPAAWAAWYMVIRDMPMDEIVLHASAILAYSMGIVFLGREFYGYWGERKERMRVVELLRMRQEAGDTTLRLAAVTSAWHGNEGQGSVIQDWQWNAKFRRIKRAVESGKLKGTLRDKIKSEADIGDLIRYFSSRID